MPHFIVEQIEFDFDDESYGYDPLTKEEEKSIIDQTLGVWHVEEENELVDKITDNGVVCEVHKILPEPTPQINII